MTAGVRFAAAGVAVEPDEADRRMVSPDYEVRILDADADAVAGRAAAAGATRRSSRRRAAAP